MAEASKTSESSAKPANRRGRPPAQVEPKKWRVRGRSIDGTTVTLGRYDTEEEATNAREMRVKEGIFENLRVLAIKLDPEPAEDEEETPPQAPSKPAAKSKADEKPSAKSKSKAKPKTKAKSKAKAKSNSKSDPKAASKTKSKAKPKAAAKKKTKSKTKTKRKAKSKSK